MLQTPGECFHDFIQLKRTNPKMVLVCQQNVNKSKLLYFFHNGVFSYKKYENGTLQEIASDSKLRPYFNISNHPSSSDIYTIKGLEKEPLVYDIEKNKLIHKLSGDIIVQVFIELSLLHKPTIVFTLYSVTHKQAYVRKPVTLDLQIDKELLSTILTQCSQ